MKVVKEMTRDENYMLEALKLANEAKMEKEIPVGAVIVFKDKIIGKGRNRKELSQNPLLHAEIEAINCASKYLKSWRLIDCEIYVTLEPCPMCAGAIINSRISRVIYGAKDPKAGSCGSIVNLFELPYNHKPSVFCGVLKKECSSILSNFFKELREEKTNLRNSN